jgi:predicted RNA-binding Zn ribbon-like protein
MANPAPATVLLPIPAEPLCLDFANTRQWRGSTPPTETLAAPKDLAEWLDKAGLPGAAALRARWRADPTAAAADLEAARALREAIYRLLAAPVPDDAALAAFNGALAQAPERRCVELTDRGFCWRIEPWAPTVPTLLAPVLWSAAELLAGQRHARVRPCANPKCGWLFIDDSKAGNRRWCSMAWCGNRAKAHRHYARRRRLAAGSTAAAGQA